MPGPKSTGSRKRRGPRRLFDVAEVIEAALKLVDADGPDALSVRAVANALGINPNAVYTYVPNRSALEGAIVERVLSDADVELLAGDAGLWRERIRGFATSLRRAILRHPGVARLLMTAQMNGPNALLVGERLLGALSDAGIAPEEAARAMYLIFVHALGSVALEVAETDGRPPLPPESDRIAGRRSAFEQISAADWPRTAQVMEAMSNWIGTEQFDWGLARILDAIAPAKRT